MAFSNFDDEDYAKKLQQQMDDEEYAQKLSEQLSYQPTASPFQFGPQPAPQPIYNPSQQYRDVVTKVSRMASDSSAKRLASKYGLQVTTVSWEDNARSKNSSWGPCISDMTLQVEGQNVPVIRSPNFQDLTWDVPIEKIPLIVGNENGLPLRSITLKEYLDKFTQYLHNQQTCNVPYSSLLAPRDAHVVASSQACFLPVPATGGEAKFNVAIFNYQTQSTGNPAVLAIVATKNGTSVQVVDERGHRGQKLYFNDNGKKCSFVGERLSQHRIEKGDLHLLGKPMTNEEKQENMILVIQIPLKTYGRTKQKVFYGGFGNYCDNNLMDEDCWNENNFEGTLQLEKASMPMMSLQAQSCFDSSSQKKKRSRAREFKESADVEDAIVKVGQAEGEFTELGTHRIERDTNYPIRVTLQFYKATSNGVASAEHMAEIYNQLKESRKFGVEIGSLVVGGYTGRITEPNLPPPTFCFPAPAPYPYPTPFHPFPLIPAWWNDFWLMYRPVFPQYTEEQARALVFRDGRFANTTLDACLPQVVNVLGNSRSPSWNVM